MSPRALTALLALSLAFLGGCAPARLDPSAPPEQQVLFRLSTLGKAMETNDFKEILPYFAEDVVLVEGSQKPVQGTEALKLHLRGIRVPIERTRLTPIATYAEGDGVRQTGTLIHVLQMPGGRKGTASGRFEALWAKGPDGQWRIRRWEVVSLN